MKLLFTISLAAFLAHEAIFAVRNTGVNNGNIFDYWGGFGNLYGDQYAYFNNQGGNGQARDGFGAYGSPFSGNQGIFNYNLVGDGDQYGTVNFNSIGSNNDNWSENIPITASYREN